MEYSINKSKLREYKVNYLDTSALVSPNGLDSVEIILEYL